VAEKVRGVAKKNGCFKNRQKSSFDRKHVRIERKVVDVGVHKLTKLRGRNPTGGGVIEGRK
jgi:hypothetical protein